MRKRTDTNHTAAMGWFRSLGAPVLDTHAVPSFVDFLALVGGSVLLIEVKRLEGKKNPRPARLTPAQSVLHSLWPVHVVATEADARRVVELHTTPA